jgi:hypothetical protein
MLLEERLTGDRNNHWLSVTGALALQRLVVFPLSYIVLRSKVLLESQVYEMVASMVISCRGVRCA